jgi:hypothetical protein
VPAHLADRVPAVPALRALIRGRIQPFARALQPAHTPSVSPRGQGLALLYHVRVEKIRKLISTSKLSRLERRRQTPAA